MATETAGVEQFQFWDDSVTVRERPAPPIPDTGWTTPELPNLSRARAISLDVETYDPELKKHGPGWARGRGHICGLAIGTDDGGRWYFPIRHTIEPETNMDPAHVLAWARDTLGNPQQPKVGANLTYDVGWLREEGVHVAGMLYDVQYAEALLDERAPVNLDALGAKYLGERKTTDVLYDWCAQFYGGAVGEAQRSNIYRAPPRLVGPYAEGDVDLPFRVMERQWPLLIEQDLMPVFDMECRLIPLMIEMRFAGVSVDLDAAERLRARLVAERDELAVELDRLIGHPVQIGSSKSLAAAFDTLGLSYGRTEKGAPSFTAEFLNTVEHPVGQLIRGIRTRDKMVGTFIDSYILDAHIDGRLYGSFHQLRGDSNGAKTGRFSSSKPNLQNIPTRTEIGREIRKCFIPDPGHRRWVKGDYSQIEYRGLAHYAVGPGAEEVRQRYHTDRATDFHAMVQRLILDVTGIKLERGAVKNVNFGTVYGMGVKALAHSLGLSVQAAEELLEAIHAGAPFLRSTMQAIESEAERLGYITTILGRRTRFDLWEPGDWSPGAAPLPLEDAARVYRNPRRAYIRNAMNYRLQGSAAELMKMGALQCWEGGVFHEIGVPRLTVHDELDFSDPGGKDEGFTEMRRIMESAVPFSVPVLFDMEYGPNWGTVE